MDFGPDNLDELQNHLKKEYDISEAADMYQRIEAHIEETGDPVSEEEVQDFELMNYVKRFSPLASSELDEHVSADISAVKRELEASDEINSFDVGATNLRSDNSLRTGHTDPVLHSVDERPEVVVDYFLEANDIEISEQKERTGSSWAAHYAMSRSNWYKDNSDRARNVLKYRDPEGWRGETNREKQLNDSLVWEDGEWQEISEQEG